VIDINYYAVPQAENSNMKHRPVGLGIMGFQDALYELGIAYGSDEAVQFADESMEVVSYYAIEASAELARERGAYSSFDGSLWSQGVLPIDSIEKLREERGANYLNMDTSAQLDWTELEKKPKVECGTQTSWPSHQQPRSQTSLACRNRLNPPTKTST